MHANQDQIDPNNPSVDVLLWAYQRGIFPMADPDTGELDWYSPDPRAVFELDQFHVPKNVSRLVKQQKFEIRSNSAFEEIMRHCAKARSDDNLTWISDQLISIYCHMHEIGHAHSLEAWFEGKLVGGLYGVQIGGVFFGESMFSNPDIGGTNSSKVCLVHLVEKMKREGFTLLDTQFWTPHLHQFGCVEISREEYLIRLADALKLSPVWNTESPVLTEGQ